MRIVGTLWTLQTFNLPRYPDQPKKIRKRREALITDT
jgi:hypothetical protein